jgi:hypothetical protein
MQEKNGSRAKKNYGGIKAKLTAGKTRKQAELEDYQSLR